ncbi:MAG TPA: hypothetical protein VNA12_03510 [Mycobacteriales bacterium]|nr:hypothetical protein [Mycobacteriales bacterium]
MVRAARQVRIGLLVLLVPTAVTGLHALLAPRSWYDDFTGGIAPPAAFGAYNEHFVQDLGGGYLGVAAAVLWALFHLRADVVRCALAAFLVFNVPHLAIHLAVRGDLDDTGYLFVNAGLGVSVLVACWLWFAAGRLGTGGFTGRG